MIFIEDFADKPIDKHRVIWYDPHDLKTSSIEYERWGFNMSYVSGSLTFLTILGTHFGHFEKSNYPFYLGFLAMGRAYELSRAGSSAKMYLHKTVD